MAERAQLAEPASMQWPLRPEGPTGQLALLATPSRSFICARNVTLTCVLYRLVIMSLQSRCAPIFRAPFGMLPFQCDSQSRAQCSKLGTLCHSSPEHEDPHRAARWVSLFGPSSTLNLATFIQHLISSRSLIRHRVEQQFWWCSAL